MKPLALDRLTRGLAVAGMLLPLIVGVLSAQPVAEGDDPHAGHTHGAGEAHAHHVHQHNATVPPPPAPDWPAETLELFARTPIQAEGRVKPLSTFARFELVRLSGKSRVRLEDGSRLDSLAWLLNCLFYPHVAQHYPVILVENPAVMRAVGLPDEEPRRRFSLVELDPAAAAITALAQQAVQKEDKARTLFERQVLALYQNYAELNDLLQGLLFARTPIVDEGQAAVAEQLEGISAREMRELPYSGLLNLLPRMIDRLPDPTDPAARERLNEPENQQLMGLIARIEAVANRSRALALIPPMSDREREEYYSAGTLLTAAAGGQAGPELALLGALEQLPEQLGDPERFRATLAGFVSESQSAVAARGDAPHLELEIFFYRLKPFHWGLLLFLLGFVLVGLVWLQPGNRWFAGAAWSATGAATLLLIVGITLRCIIRVRPPVSTLYETTLFIPAVAIVVALAIEWINRRRVALSLAAALGVVGLFVANAYELREGGDTMGRLVAVLNSNFWLSTHVTTVTMGYSAGLLAAALGHVYIFTRLVAPGRRELLRQVARMCYGVICFGLLFSFVGTVLGGIWANYSWGRFWGWDPKENGALLIVLANLMILHARLGGYLRDLGICISAVLLAIVVTLSWWGVNLLGIGLHSYGFTTGIMGRLLVFWAIESVVVAVGLLVHARDAAVRRATAGVAGAEGAAGAAGEYSGSGATGREGTEGTPATQGAGDRRIIEPINRFH